MLQNTTEFASANYWIFQFCVEVSIIWSVIFIAIFWSHLTSPSAKNFWLILLLICTIADIAVILCLIFYPKYKSIFLHIYNFSSVLYFIGMIGIWIGLGFLSFYQMYKYTREPKAFGLSASLLVSVCADIFTLIYWFARFLLAPVPEWWDDMRTISMAVDGIGKVLFFIIILTDVDYIYRLPFDVHMLLICYRSSGIPIYHARFSTKKPIQIEETLLAGLFTALNNVFREVGRQEISLEHVAGSGLHFLLKWGENVVTLVVADKDTYFLRQAIQQFSRDFQAHFHGPIQSQTPNLDAYNSTAPLIESSFPFLSVKTD